jgi:fimbrial isopeptide formation D2 family protein/LPXTG-motif cell wall-anchored protein
MKRIKKLAALMMAAIMALAMSITAFAADVTENDSDASKKVEHTYEIYQIFIGDYAKVEGKDVLSNIKWGGNSKHRTGEVVDDAVLKELEAVQNATSDTEKLAVINKYANLDSTPMMTGTETKYTGLTPGYYLVKDKDGSLSGTNEAHTLYVVQVVNDTLEFTPKGDVPETDKKIVEGEDKVTTNEASIGDEVNYEITGTMPTNIADYKEYYYVFTDTLSKGLTFDKDSVKVTVDGVDVTKYFYIGAEQADENSPTVITVGIQDILALRSIAERVRIDFTKDTKVVLTYTATLNENAVIAGDGNPNDVKLSYSNDPNNSGNGTTNPPENPEKPSPVHPNGETPEIEVVTYTTELTILKTDEEGNFLPGVEFTLTGNGVNIVLVTEETFTEDADGEYWKLTNDTYTTTPPTIAGDETDNSADYDDVNKKYKKTTSVVAKGNGKTETDVVGTVQADGTVTFKGLGAGEYTITETKTLPGYNTIEPIQFKLTFNAETKTFVSDNENVTVGEDNMLDTSIVNQKGSLLPSTGGIGTTIFYIVGAVLVIGAGIILVTKKRMSNEV